jgi:predicted lipoprotein with Yx(FWY)xxD motif
MSAVVRTLTVVAVAAVVGSLQGGLAGTSGSRAKLQLRPTSVGTILVNGRGYTLYAFAKDRRNEDACARLRGCLSVWPALTTGARPVAGRSVRSSLIGTIALNPGVRQITYAGHPLYTYVADIGPGETTYVNIPQFGGRWPAMDAAGHEVKSAPRSR